MVISLFVLLSFLSTPVTDNSGSEALTIHAPDLECESGALMIAVFNNSETFLSDNAFYKDKFPCAKVKNKKIVLNLPKGSYGIAIYHDENGDGKLNKNFVGYPSEPFGFSNNPQILVRAPSWKDAVFQHSGDTTIEIRWN